MVTRSRLFLRVFVLLLIILGMAYQPHMAVANGDGSERESRQSMGLLPSAPKRHVSLHRRSPNPFGSQYFQAWSAIPLDRGEGLYRNMLVSWNAVSYGSLRISRSVAGSGSLLHPQFEEPEPGVEHAGAGRWRDPDRRSIWRAPRCISTPP